MMYQGMVLLLLVLLVVVVYRAAWVGVMKVEQYGAVGLMVCQARGCQWTQHQQ